MAEKPTASAAPKSDSLKEEPAQRPPPGLPPSIQRLFTELFAEKEKTGQQQASANEKQVDIEERRSELEQYNTIMLHELANDMGKPDTR